MPSTPWNVKDGLNATQVPAPLPAATSKPRIAILFTDAGGGHRATAAALADLLEPEAEVIRVNPYREALAHLDLFDRVLGIPGEEVYNVLVLRRGWVGVVEWLFRQSVRFNIWSRSRAGHRALCALWERLKPDLVVSVMPWLNGAALSALSESMPHAPYLILVTDLEETWRGQWFPDQNGFVAIYSGETAADRLRHRPVATHRLSGLLIRQEFLEPQTDVEGEVRRRLGLETGRPTIGMLYGGEGSRKMLELADALKHLADAPQVIFICGRNEALASSLRAANLPYPHAVLGFTGDIASLLRASDLFVGKPGPGSISEALAAGVPVLLDATRVLPQERCNLRWVVDAGVGEVFRDRQTFLAAIERFMAGGLAAFTAAARRHDNRSAQEMIEIVRQYLPDEPS